MAVLMGVLPGLFLRPMEPSVVRAVDRITGAQPARAQNLAPSTSNAEPRTSNEAGGHHE
jgi:hypothetical protein